MKSCNHIWKEKVSEMEVSRRYSVRILFMFTSEIDKNGTRYAKWLECKSCGKIKNAKEWGTNFLDQDSGGSNMTYELEEDEAEPINSLRILRRFIQNPKDIIQQDSDEDK